MTNIEFIALLIVEVLIVKALYGYQITINGNIKREKLKQRIRGVS